MQKTLNFVLTKTEILNLQASISQNKQYNVPDIRVIQHSFFLLIYQTGTSHLGKSKLFLVQFYPDKSAVLIEGLYICLMFLFILFPLKAIQGEALWQSVRTSELIYMNLSSRRAKRARAKERTVITSLLVHYIVRTVFRYTLDRQIPRMAMYV